MTILTDAFRHVKSVISPILPDNAHQCLVDTMSQTELVDIENMNVTSGEFMSKLEPILDHYSTELSDRVLAIVEEKLQDQERCKPSLETDI